MFLRFSKCVFSQTRIYTKCVLIDGVAIMEHNNKIVGIGNLHERTEKYNDYDIIEDNHRRKYYVEILDGEELPIKPKIVFTKNE